jgi:lipoprotein-anchoring transpeptidase ErfK/SrfK
MLVKKSKHKRSSSKASLLIIFAAIFSALFSSACQPPKPAAAQEPRIEATPLGQDVGPWKVITADTLTLTVTAPGATQVKLLYKPIDAVSRYAEMGTLTAAEGQEKFTQTWQAGPDFTGDVWAEVSWPNGNKKKTEVLSLTSEAALNQGGEIPLDRIGNSAKTDESARADHLTGGKIESKSLSGGDPRIWITVNIPAFRLTLWQNGKEVKTYQIGIGRLDFPLPVGERKASEIIWNPDWIPPDSKWVKGDVEPGERIAADDPRNPLGKIKIRLGNAILIHEAAKPSDIGHLVSHGCVRLLTDDLFDLSEKIVAALNLPVTQTQIEQAKQNTERLAVKLDPPLWVDINYDTEVIERGVLHLYPDVYRRTADELAALRAELTRRGIENTDEKTLKQMLERVNRKQEFAVPLTEIKTGRALTDGQQVPLTDYSTEPKPDA